MDAPKTQLANSNGHKYSTLLLIGGVFILILGGLFFTINEVGNAYKKNLAAISPDTNPQEYTLQKKRTVKKITIKRSDESGCIEVNPDGVVRIYATCGGELTSASRLTDVKNVQRLFTIVSEADLALYKGTGTLYELTLETDSGTQRMVVVLGGTQAPGASEIIQTITQITGDLPSTSPTPTPRPIGPSPSITPFSSSSPTPGHGGTTFPSPTPTSAPQEPFKCDFTESGKPIRVSNVVCTSEPR